MLPTGAFWQGTTIGMPAGRWRDVFEGGTLESSGTVAAGEALAALPFAVLRMV